MRLTCQLTLSKGFLCLLFFIPFITGQKVSAQQNSHRVVNGIVTNAKGEPLVGASVVMKGSNTGTTTDANGGFTIRVQDNATIVVSSIGFQNQELVPKGTKTIAIHLSETSNDLNDVVVVGYGTVKKKDLTGSVAVIKVDDAKKTATYDVAKMLQGQAAGISVHGSGEPGGYVQIKIRGTSTFLNNSPLFVIDGVLVDAPFDFNPDDIESIQVLKDASAGAIYGSRGATGVVIITTKKGKAGAPKVNYTGTYGWQHITKKIPVMNREQYQQMVRDAEKNAGLSLAPGNDPASPFFIKDVNTDWQKEMFKTGVIQDHNVSLSGGNDATTYNISLGYFGQTSTINGPQQYNRYTFNNSLQGKKGIFSYGGKLSYSQSHKVNYGLTNGHAVFGGSINSMLSAIPTMPVYDPKRLGGYGGSDNVTQRAITLNVIGLNNLIEDNSDRNRFLGNVWGEVEILKNLKYKLNLSYDRTDWVNNHFEPKFDLGFYYLNTKFYMLESRGSGNSMIAENTLSYQLQLAKHKIDFLAGYTFQKDNFGYTTGTATDTSNLLFRTFANVGASAKGLTSYLDSRVLLSYLGRINYNYEDRYLVTANFRRDGSSRFAPANQYGNFASVAAAWNVGNEKFLRLPGFISSLKLRGGYGSLGNENSLGNYLFQSYINPNASYVFGNTLAPGATTVSQVDQSIKWESRYTTNVAADMGFLNNKLQLTVEYFKNTSKDLLLRVPIPVSVGSVPSSVFTNAASMQNSGIELTLNYNNQAGPLKYSISANAYTLKNKVLQLGQNNNPLYGAGSKTEVGHEVGELYGYVVEGIFQNASDIAKHAKQPNAAAGDLMFKDINGDGKISDDSDRVYLGSAIPKLYYGFNFNASYKNFDFSFFLQGNAGSKVFNGVYQAITNEQYSNQHIDVLNYWTPSNTNTDVPRPVIGDPNSNGRFSTRFVESGSYIRLQNIQIGYTFPSELLRKIKGIKNVRINLSGQNVFTLSKYKGYDPDFINDGVLNRGFDYGSYPNPRSVILGLQVGF